MEFLKNFICLLLGKGMNRRMKAVNTFEFLPIHVDENVNCIISITGYDKNQVFPSCHLIN